jgi:hypothetical protein
MRITTILKAAAAPAIIMGGLLATTTGAFASTGPVSNGQAGQITGNNATVYNDPYFGPVSCNETQHPGFDTIGCHAVVIGPDGKVVKGATALPLWRPAGETNQVVGWVSDFGGNFTAPKNGVDPYAGRSGGTLNYTVSTDGMSYTGQATYPAS